MNAATFPRQKPIHFLQGYDSLSFEEKRCAQVLANMQTRNDTDLHSMTTRLDRSQFVVGWLVLAVLRKTNIQTWNL